MDHEQTTHRWNYWNWEYCKNTHGSTCAFFLWKGSILLSSQSGKSRNLCKDNLEAFLESADVIDILTPSGAHGDIAIQAAKHKKHVLVEKPMEITTARCDEMIKAAKANSVRLGVIYNNRYLPTIAIVKKALDEQRFGTIISIDVQLKWNRDTAYFTSAPWRGIKALNGGGVLMNQGSHMMDLIVYFLGLPSRVYGEGATLVHSIEVEDTFNATLAFPSGALGSIQASTAIWPAFGKKIEICGSDGSIVLQDDSFLTYAFRNEKAEDEQIRRRFAPTGKMAATSFAVSDYTDHLQNIDAFLESIIKKTPFMLSGEEARKSVLLIEKLYESAEKKAPVRI